MIHCTEHRTWLDVEKFADSRDKNWTYIILGTSGPTGKTYLWNKLREKGYNVIELSEDFGPLVKYRDNENHYLIYEYSKCLVIMLNKPLRKERV